MLASGKLDDQLRLWMTLLLLTTAAWRLTAALLNWNTGNSLHRPYLMQEKRISLGRVQYTILHEFVCSIVFVRTFSMKLQSTQERTISLEWCLTGTFSRVQYVPYYVLYPAESTCQAPSKAYIPSGKAGYSTFWKGRVQYLLERQGTVPSGKAGCSTVCKRQGTVPSGKAGYSTFWKGRVQYLLERQGTVPSGKAGCSTVCKRQGTVPSEKAGMCWTAGEQARSAWCPPGAPAHAPSQQLAATVCWPEPSCSETLASPPNPLQPTSKSLTSEKFVEYS